MVWHDRPVSQPTRRLLDAVTALLVEEGFEGVSVRKVAARAGVSIGAVQHHFPTKDAMLNAVMEEASEEFQRRLATRIPADATAEQALRAVVHELLVLDPDGRVATVVWTQRLARAMVDPSMRDRHAQEWLELEQLIAHLLRGVVPDQPSDWASDQAAFLLALVDGLAISQVVEPDRIPAERAERLVAEALDRLLTHPSP